MGVSENRFLYDAATSEFFHDTLFEIVMDKISAAPGVSKKDLLANYTFREGATGCFLQRWFYHLGHFINLVLDRLTPARHSIGEEWILPMIDLASVATVFVESVMRLVFNLRRISSSSDHSTLTCDTRQFLNDDFSTFYMMFFKNNFGLIAQFTKHAGQYVKMEKSKAVAKTKADECFGQRIVGENKKNWRYYLEPTRDQVGKICYSIFK